METILTATALKYLGAIVAGFYGVYATLTDFRDDKDGKRRLTRRGYFGIGLLVCSLVVSLTSNVIEDAEKRKDSAKRVQAEQKILDDLSAQLKTTENILDLAANQVKSIQVRLFVSIDPLILDESGNYLIPADLAAKLLRGGDDVQLYDPVTRALRKNYLTLRQIVFKDWEFDFRVRRPDATSWLDHDMWERMQQQDGLKSFVISHVSGDFQGHFGVQCWLSYEFVPNSVAGLRTYKDFNGAAIEVDLEPNNAAVHLTTVRIDIGGENKLKDAIFIQEERFQRQASGTVLAETTIPMDRF